MRSPALCRTIATGILVFGIGAAPAAAQTAISAPIANQQVHAAATVQVPLQADRALVYVALAARHAAGEIAVREVSSLHAAVMEALGEFGFEGVPWGFGFGNSMEVGVMMSMGGSRPTPERLARQGVRISVERIEELDGLLSRLAEVGIEGVPFVQFASSRAAEARLEAVEQAVGEARREAEAMARAAGGRLGAMIRIATTPEPMIGSSSLERVVGMSPGMDRGAPLAVGDPTIRVTVQGTWQFLPN